MAEHRLTQQTRARLIEFDDNLAGAELSPLGTAVFLAGRKRVCEKLHPDPATEPFVFLSVSVLLPSDLEDAPASARLVLENLDSALVELLRGFLTPAEVCIAVAMADTPDEPEAEWLGLRIVQAEADPGTILLAVSREEVEGTGIKGPAGTHVAGAGSRDLVPNRPFDLGVRVRGREVTVWMDGRRLFTHTITEAQDAALGNNFGLTARLGAVVAAPITQPGIAREIRVWPLTPRPAGYPLCIAHRGVRNAPFSHATELSRTGIGPENCFSMVEDLPEGVGVEFDVQVSSDGVPVIMHDTTVTRTTNGTGSVASMTAAQITALTVRGVGGRRVPTLAELLAALEYRPDIPEIIVDWKAGDHATILAVIAAAPASVLDRIVYFPVAADVATIRALGGLGATIRIAIGSQTTANAAALPDMVALGVEIGLTPPNATAAQLEHLAVLRDAGLRPYMFTTQLHYLARPIITAGLCDGFLSDYPRAFRWP